MGDVFSHPHSLLPWYCSYDLGDFEQGKEFYERALIIRLKKLDPGHLDVAISYNNLVNVHSDLGDLEQAKEYYERALTFRLKKLDPDHLNVATCYNNLGNVHSHLGDLSQAKDYYEHAPTIYLKSSTLTILLWHRVTITLVMFTAPWVTLSRPNSIMNVHLPFI